LSLLGFGRNGLEWEEEGMGWDFGRLETLCVYVYLYVYGYVYVHAYVHVYVYMCVCVS
jgi:hypothetical protein